MVNKIITKQPKIIKPKDNSKKSLDNKTKKFSVTKLLCPFLLLK